MTSLMIFSVYSLRLSSEIPIQSMYLPMINLYFVFSIIYTLLGFIWFTVYEHLKKKECLSLLLDQIIDLCLIFNKVSSKQVNSKSRETCDDENGAKKDREERNLNVLNMVVFSIFFLVILIFNITIWVSISTV